GAVSRRAEPGTQHVDRGTERRLAPGEVLAERAPAAEIPDLLKRARERLPTRRVREAAAADRIGLEQRGVIELRARPKWRAPIALAYDGRAAHHRLQLSARARCGGCRVRASRRDTGEGRGVRAPVRRSCEREHEYEGGLGGGRHRGGSSY